MILWRSSRWFSLLSLAALVNVSDARRSVKDVDENIYAACRLALSPIHFLTNGTRTPSLTETCQNHDRIQSLYLCLQEYGNGSSAFTGLHRQNLTCHNRTQTWLPPLALISSIPREDLLRLRRLTLDDRSNAVKLNETVIVEQRLYNAAYNTLDGAAYAHRHHMLYALAVIVFWIAVIILALVFRYLLLARSSPQSRGRHGKQADTAWFKFRQWLKGWFLVPATFGYRCSQNLGWCTIPPRIQSLTILSFVVINLVFCIHGYRITEDNLYFSGTYEQLLRYVSDRTGIISFANFPLIWLFGMRNNLLLWLTGWSFGTYNNFHRWVARVATLQAVIHSIGYTLLVLRDGGWSYFAMWWSYLFWWTGEVATMLMCAILALSVFWMRRKHYEVFLLVHIVFSILILVTMLGHVSIFKGRFNVFVWIPVAVWLLDRLLRVSRTLLFNPRFWRNWALVSYESQSNIMRFQVANDWCMYAAKPGTYYYIHVLGHKFWESHPFTMAYSTSTRDVALQIAGEQAPLLSDDAELLLGKREAESPSMTFLIRPYDSFTKRLRNLATAQWPSPTAVRALIEGPYGHTEPLHTFDRVLFIVGGSGIVVPLSYMSSLIASRTTSSIHIVWAVRELQFAQEVIVRDFASLLNHEKLSLKVCMTCSYEATNALHDTLPSIRIQSKRPDVHEEVMRASKSAGHQSLAVVCCGPSTMNDDTRRAVVSALDENKADIEYFEESFRW